MASALVELEDRKTTATAFCLHKSGIFVTNHHVVKSVKPDGSIRLVLNVATPEEKSVRANVVRVDIENDLAILRTTEPGAFVSLTPGNTDDAFETMQTITFGFPFGKELSFKEGILPSISVSTGRITAIRREGSDIKLLQLDAEINPGNSGGPVLDLEGNVIGVVSFGVFGTGINFAIPIHRLTRLMQRPDVVAEYPALTAENLHETHRLKVTLTPLVGAFSDPTLEATLKIDKTNTIQIPMTSGNDGTFHAEFVPVASNSPVSESMKTRVRFSGGMLDGMVENREFQVGEKKVKLKETTLIQRQRTSDQFLVRLKDGSEHKGVLTGLSEVAVDLGTVRVQIDFTACVDASVKYTSRTPTFEYTLVVRDADREIDRSTTIVGIDGKRKSVNLAPASSMAETATQTYQGQKQSIKMTSEISDIVGARGGRLLLVVMSKNKELAIVDTGEGAIVKVIPLSSENVLVAGTENHAFVFDCSKNLIERWSLITYERELTVDLPFKKGVVKAVAAGSSSAGPVLVHWAAGTEALDSATYSFLQAETLTDLNIKSSGNVQNNHYRDAVQIRAAADGRSFGMWCTSHGPQGLQHVTLSASSAEFLYVHQSAGHVVPSPDGTSVFSGYAGVLAANLSPRFAKKRGNIPVFPTSHPKFFMSVAADPDAQVNLIDKTFGGARPSLHTIDSEAALLTLPNLELGEQSSGRGWESTLMTLDKRVHYIVSNAALLSIPFTNDRIIIQHFDLAEELGKSQSDYLFVTSSPEKHFQPGKPYEIRIEVASRSPGLEFELRSGPEGMEVSNDGVVKWDVPANFTERTVSVFVGIRNSADKSIVESFTLTAKTD